MSKLEAGRKKTGGRKKGTPNKSTAVAKEAIAIAGHELGGAERLVAWVKEDPANEKVFWSQIYTKLLPVQLGTEGEGLHIHLHSDAKKV